MSALAIAARTLSQHRLLPGDGDTASLEDHLERYGALPRLRNRESALIAAIGVAGLTGRGGADFPTAVKLRSVRQRGGSVVVANGTEGEPASAKDKALLTLNPHLVLDGVLLATQLVGARDGVVAVSREARPSIDALDAAVAERGGAAERIRIATVPERFVAGEETALVSWLNGGDAKPTFAPPRPFERGVGGKPTLVQNVETLANIALIARYGPAWFRELGSDTEPGSVLVTVGGAVRHPGVIEVERGMPVRALLERCGGPTAAIQALLVGGYFGSWLPGGRALAAPFSAAALGPLGARALYVLPESACGVVETARVAAYLAEQSAGQCGPCIFGLAAAAANLDTIADSRPDAAAALERLPGLQRQIARRGACAHPDGAIRFIASAIDVFAHEIERHLAGSCSAHDRVPVLPTTATSGWS